MDSYLVKYNNQGKLLWQRQFGGQNYQIIEDIDFAEDGSIYGTGQYSYECILMDAIKSAQKSKYEYKSGHSLFYFHFFDDGETDFVRFEDGRGYNGSFMGMSIDLDLNGDSHIIGSFTDTLLIDDFEIKGPVYPSCGFTSVWEQNELVQLEEIGSMTESWMLATRVRSSTSNYAIGGMYYGADVNVKINGKKEKLGFSQYGRCSFIYGGLVKDKRDNQNQEVLADMREINRVKRLDGLEALFACKSPVLEDAATTWYPTLDSIPSRDSLWIYDTPCGLVIEDMEASLFPNPTAGPVTVRLKGMLDKLVQIDVYSERGQLMYSQRVQVPMDDYNVDFDMTSAAAGIYFVRITHGNFEKALRLVKMKI
jgi:Secretion system C-terminal sorting domain